MEPTTATAVNAFQEQRGGGGNRCFCSPIESRSTACNFILDKTFTQALADFSPRLSQFYRDPTELRCAVQRALRLPVRALRRVAPYRGRPIFGWRVRQAAESESPPPRFGGREAPGCGAI